MTVDLLVCGLGPAGRALTHRALAQGLTVTAIDPTPERQWSATYAGWADELPNWLEAAVVAARVERPVAWGTRAHRVERTYVVFDTGRLRAALTVTGAQVITDRAVDLRRQAVTLASGSVLTGRRVVDACGIARSPALAEQTAFGINIERDRCAGIEPLLMDWRPDNGAPADAPPSFLYAVPRSDTTMLLEETCLAGRPALDGAELRERLLRRLMSRDIELAGDEPRERVRFPITGGRPGRRTFGAAGAFTHPATGYSVTAALAAADSVAAGASAWPASARAVRLLRTAGLRVLLALPPTDIPVFFDAFFTLSPALQRTYLSGRTDLAGTRTAMRTLFDALPPRLRRRVAVAAVGIPVPSRGRMCSAIMGV